MPLSPREVFHKLVHGVAAGRWDDLPQLYAERTYVEHPFDPWRAPPLCSRDQIREHFRAVPASPPRRRPANITIHDTADPEVIVAEFEYQGTAAEDPFRVPCIFVLRVRDGEIVASRDYIDHLSTARAWGRLDELITRIQET